MERINSFSIEEIKMFRRPLGYAQLGIRIRV